MDDDGARALASGIVAQAVLDWYQCEAVIRKQTTAKKWDTELWKNPVKLLTEAERFLLGTWFNTLSCLDGAALLSVMRASPKLNLHGNWRKTMTRQTEKSAASWKKLARFPELRAALEEKQISRGALAAALGVSERTLFNWVTGGPTRDHMEKIWEAIREIGSRQ